MNESWGTWKPTIEEIAHLCESMKFDVYQGLHLEIGDGLSADALSALHQSVGPLPEDYLATLRASRSVVFRYYKEGVGAFGPYEALWDDRYLLWCGQVATQFGYSEPGSEGQWVTPFAHLVDDDFIAFRMDGSERHGEVFFAAHDDHESKPRIARSFTELMDRCAMLCFPDYESLLEDHWDQAAGEIDCEGPAAQDRLALVEAMRTTAKTQE